jgi:uncharacterized coiled-coil protein SlyX
MNEQLTQQELQTLINVLAQTQTIVAQAGTLIDLINKMSRMIDHLRAQAIPKTQPPPQSPSKADLENNSQQKDSK